MSKGKILLVNHLNMGWRRLFHECFVTIPASIPPEVWKYPLVFHEYKLYRGIWRELVHATGDDQLLAGQRREDMVQEAFWMRLLEKPEIVGILIPIIAVIAVSTLGVIKLWMRHRERMAMIERGIHPDYPPEDETTPGPPAKT
jgi:hypothetical protein